MISNQETLTLSPYMAIYDIVVPKDNQLRIINELVDFTFIYEELKGIYCLDNGRNAIPPIRMFKYLLLKSIFDRFDVDHVERSKEDEFEFNKDAGMYVCKAGHMAIRKARQGKKNQGKNQRDTYYFDIEKCQICPFKEGCYKEGAKSKTYSVTIKSTEHKDHEAFQNSEEFKDIAKSRYKIEAKNSEIKHRHGYETANSAVLFGMQIQGATAIFAVNLKRIISLLNEGGKVGNPLGKGICFSVPSCRSLWCLVNQ